ncbi:MAG: GHKL domain-containing protein [Defluviitaleaceae bacterium]|nr:GHKL domain-containing protein [Defluviitaleaceae bacterium]
MSNGRRKYSAITTAILAAVVCCLAVCLCLAVYRYDNKYTAPGPQAQNGVLTLDGQSLAAYPAVFLVDGWEYYGGRLLTPEDFAVNPPVPDQYIFIGRYGGFDVGNPNTPPHGSASYRLKILIPDDVRAYTLELPEIYSAYRLYVNGKLTLTMGDPDPANYRPATGDQSVSIQAGGSIDILLAVSDFSHFYSGVVYPPIFGEPNAVSAIANARLAFRCALCAIALTIGVLAALIGFLSRKKKLAVLYGLLCVFFVGYVCYPIIRTFVTGFQVEYAIENFSYNAMLAVIMLLARAVCGQKNKLGYIFIVFGFFMCFVEVIMPFLIPLGNLRIMMTYSALVSAYEWIAAAYITGTAVYSMIKGKINSRGLLFGFLIFDVSLVMDRILPLDEPIVTGWFIELASFALVLFVGVVIGREVAAGYREAAVMTERANSMERIYQSAQSYFTVLRQEMDETEKVRHDMRHHFTMIGGFVKNRQYEKLSEYLAVHGETFRASGERKEYCPIDVINILSGHYEAIAEQNRIYLDIRCDFSAAAGEAEPEYVGMSDSDLCGLYSNLLENAVEACLRVKTGRRVIRVAVVRPTSDSLTICVWNSTDGNVRAEGDGYLSSKEEGRTGYGLRSIQSIAKKYGGRASFKWDRGERTFESKVTITA